MFRCSTTELLLDDRGGGVRTHDNPVMSGCSPTSIRYTALLRVALRLGGSKPPMTNSATGHRLLSPSDLHRDLLR